MQGLGLTANTDFLVPVILAHTRRLAITAIRTNLLDLMIRISATAPATNMQDTFVSL